jgi:hypothetical protein
MQNKLNVGSNDSSIGEKIQSEFERSAKFTAAYYKNPYFQTQVTTCIRKMDFLIKAISNVNLCKERYPKNLLCLGSSLSQLIEVLFEINFSVDKIIPTVESLKHINK